MDDLPFMIQMPAPHQRGQWISLHGLYGIARKLLWVRGVRQCGKDEQLVQQAAIADSLLGSLRNLPKIKLLRENGHLLRHAALDVDQPVT